MDGREVHLPAGVAHFLEHKMFEDEDGDAFAKFAKTGANANAFTSFDRTCYLFTATEQLDESLDVLLGMVTHPYFTEQTIAKEQGIIGQEIKMYDDSADWRLITGLCECLYHSHPIRSDIAGTVESIAEIPPELLSRFPAEKRDALIGVLAQDPRPRYQTDASRDYGLEFGGYEVKFSVNGQKMTVTDITEKDS